MIYSDKCFYCSCKKDIDKEISIAKDWWKRYHLRYVFACGACYNPESPYSEIYPYRSCSKD